MALGSSPIVVEVSGVPLDRAGQFRATKDCQEKVSKSFCGGFCGGFGLGTSTGRLGLNTISWAKALWNILIAKPMHMMHIRSCGAFRFFKRIVYPSSRIGFTTVWQSRQRSC